MERKNQFKPHFLKKYVDESGVIWLDEFTKKIINRKLRGLEDKEIVGVIGEYNSIRICEIDDLRK